MQSGSGTRFALVACPVGSPQGVDVAGIRGVTASLVTDIIETDDKAQSGGRSGSDLVSSLFARAK